MARQTGLSTTAGAQGGSHPRCPILRLSTVDRPEVEESDTTAYRSGFTAAHLFKHKCVVRLSMRVSTHSGVHFLPDAADSRNPTPSQTRNMIKTRGLANPILGAWVNFVVPRSLAPLSEVPRSRLFTEHRNGWKGTRRRFKRGMLPLQLASLRLMVLSQRSKKTPILEY
jgi:hypothetical protein